MLFVIPEIVLALCLFAERRQNKLQKKTLIYLTVISELVIGFYMCMYYFDEPQIIYIICSSIGVICTFISYTDIKEKMIRVKYCIAMIIVGIIFSFLRNDVSVYNPIITGVICFLLTKLMRKICKNQIGDGDIYLIAGYAVAYGYPLIVKFMFSALITGLLVGLIGVLFKKFTMKTELPFAPFMLAGGFVLELIQRV